MITLDTAVALYERTLDARTLCFLLNDTEVLLGLKKTGFGKGNLVGIGGGVEAGETPIAAAAREVSEEVGIVPTNLQWVGVLDFYFPYVDNSASWNQRVFVYLCRTWQGRVSETDEIKPEWFALDQLPLDKMWDDAHYWLPALLSGQQIWAQFTFDQALKVEQWHTQPLDAYRSLA